MSLDRSLLSLATGALTLGSLLAAPQAVVWGQPAAAGPFLVKPYLQLGGVPAVDALSLLWHGPDQDGAWSVAVKPAGPESVERVIRPTWIRIAVPGVEPHRVYTALLRPLAPGAFSYEVRLDGKPVFQSEAGAPKGPGQPMRVAVLGDLASGNEPPKAIAWQLHRQRPDLVVVPGDIVYQDGRITEYRKYFFPVYNADQGGPAAGAPLLRSTLFVGVLGNHYVEQWMAGIWPLLEQHRVDIAFTGHIHTYVRTQPIRFTPDPGALAALDPRSRQGELKGRLEWDAGFDGRRQTRAQGVIHIITGAGGAHLHLKGKADRFRMKPYVARSVLEENSFSLLDLEGRTLTFRQLGAQGEELDRFTLTK